MDKKIKVCGLFGHFCTGYFYTLVYVGNCTKVESGLASLDHNNSTIRRWATAMIVSFKPLLIFDKLKVIKNCINVINVGEGVEFGPQFTLIIFQNILTKFIFGRIQVL